MLMYCRECGALEPDNSRRCHICGTDFVYAVDMDKPVIEEEPPHSVKDPKTDRMGYYNFLVWGQLPVTIIAILMMTLMFATGANLGGYVFSTGEKSFDYAYAAIYAATYLPFAIYLEYSLLNFRKNAGKFFAIFTISQMIVEGIISAALYFAYNIRPDFMKILVMDVARLIFWTILAVLYLRSRKGVFEQLSEKKSNRKKQGKNMVGYNLAAWTFYPIMILINVVLLVSYGVNYITHSEAQLIEECSMEYKYVYVQAGFIAAKLVVLAWIFVKVMKKNVGTKTVLIANLLCAALESGTCLYDLRYYDNPAKEIIEMNMPVIVGVVLFLIMAVVGSIYVSKRKNELVYDKKAYRHVWM